MYMRIGWAEQTTYGTRSLEYCLFFGGEGPGKPAERGHLILMTEAIGERGLQVGCGECSNVLFELDDVFVGNDYEVVLLQLVRSRSRNGGRDKSE